MSRVLGYRKPFDPNWGPIIFMIRHSYNGKVNTPPSKKKWSVRFYWNIYHHNTYKAGPKNQLIGLVITYNSTYRGEKTPVTYL